MDLNLTQEVKIVPITIPKRKVFILWDYENIGRVVGSLKFILIAIDNLRSMALKYGEIKSFSCFFRPGEGDAETKQALQDMGVVIHEVVTQRKESVDVRILTELIDISVKEKNPFTIFLLSSDRDFSRAISMLSSRGHHTVVVYRNGAASEIAKQGISYLILPNNEAANESVEWATLLPKLDETQKRLLHQALITMFGKNRHLARPAVDAYLDRIKHNFGHSNTWTFLKFLQDWDMLVYSPKTKQYTLPREVRDGKFTAPSMEIAPKIEEDTSMPSASDIQLYITLFENIIAKLKNDSLIPREIFVMGVFEDILQHGDSVYAQLFFDYKPEDAYQRFVNALQAGNHVSVDNSTLPRIICGTYTAIDPYKPTERLYPSQQAMLQKFLASDYLWRSIDNMFDLGQYFIEKGPSFFRQAKLGYVLETAENVIQQRKRGAFNHLKGPTQNAKTEGFIFEKESSEKSPASQILRLLSKNTTLFGTDDIINNNNNNNNTGNKRKLDTQEEPAKKQKESKKQKTPETKKTPEKVQTPQKKKKESPADKKVQLIVDVLTIPQNDMEIFSGIIKKKKKAVLQQLDYNRTIHWVQTLHKIINYFHLPKVNHLKMETDADNKQRMTLQVGWITVHTPWFERSKLKPKNHQIFKELQSYASFLMVKQLESVIYQPGSENLSSVPIGHLNLLKYQLCYACRANKLAHPQLKVVQQGEQQWNAQVTIGSQVSTFIGRDPILTALAAIQQTVQQNRPPQPPRLHQPIIDMNAPDDI